MDLPILQDEPVVDIDAHAVVGAGEEAVRAALEVAGCGPGDAEVVAGHGRAGPARVPVELDERVLPLQDGLSAQLPVGIEGGRPRVRAPAPGGDAQPAPDVDEGRVADVEVDHGPLAHAGVRATVGVEMGHLGDAFAVAVLDPEPPVA